MDVEKLIRERPELFDYQDVPSEPPTDYSAQIDSITPQWLKDRLAKSR